jgi:hypothetical protein
MICIYEIVSTKYNDNSGRARNKLILITRQQQQQQSNYIIKANIVLALAAGNANEMEFLLFTTFVWPWNYCQKRWRNGMEYNNKLGAKWLLSDYITYKSSNSKAVEVVLLHRLFLK